MVVMGGFRRRRRDPVMLGRSANRRADGCRQARDRRHDYGIILLRADMLAPSQREPTPTPPQQTLPAAAAVSVRRCPSLPASQNGCCLSRMRRLACALLQSVGLQFSGSFKHGVRD